MTFSGSPYVPTRIDTDAVFQAVVFPRNSAFLEVGCGDGRVVFSAQKQGFNAVGIDVNPWLIFRAKRSASLQKSAAQFVCVNALKYDMSVYDVFYLFLLPPFLYTVIQKIQSDRAGKPTYIISHAFKIARLEKYLIHTLRGKPYNTYYYLLDNTIGN